ncbi:hypothetical protein [Candidatus Borrarchaeum sp.]|uniref:hypothetical protein n=1 Tax=Candidatus Borrarchaeum sp. TaxID=2846742 RepID=UPI00257B73F1|nr:hypothetical protein [Candidatus Borrarchaeum sp.]
MKFWKKIKNSLKNVLFGATVTNIVKTYKKMAFEMNAALMLVTIGDLIGVVVIPPIYKYNLLVHWFPYINVWKRDLLREKEFLEKLG